MFDFRNHRFFLPSSFGGRIAFVFLNNLFNYVFNLILFFISYVGAILFIEKLITPVNTTGFSSSLIGMTCVNLFFILILSCIYYRMSKRDLLNCYGSVYSVKFIYWYICMIIISVIVFYFFLVFSIYMPETGMEYRSGVFTSNSGFFMAFYSCIIAPVAEELLIRFYLYGTFKKTSSWIMAMCVSSLIFAILHGTLSHTVLAFILGCAWTVIYEATGSIWSSIACHLTYNTIVYLLSYIVGSGTGLKSFIASASIGFVVFSVVLGLMLIGIVTGMCIVMYHLHKSTPNRDWERIYDGV